MILQTVLSDDVFGYSHFEIENALDLPCVKIGVPYLAETIV